MDEIKILVVDDEERMRKLLNDFLSKEGFRVLEAADGEAALTVFFKEKDIALVILDVMMPKKDGYETAKEIRQYSEVPIMMLTARSEERDELSGFKCGVDEYITKPFSPKVLVARVHAILKRVNRISDDILEAGKLLIDKKAHEVKLDGQPIELSFKEFELLTFLVEHAGAALSREKILNQVWNYDYFGEDRTIDTHIKKLRSKLGDCKDYIHTVHGIGYKFEVES